LRDEIETKIYFRDEMKMKIYFRCLLDGENATNQNFEVPFTLMNISNDAKNKKDADLRKYFKCNRYEGVPMDRLSPAYASENATGNCDEGYVWDYSEITYSAITRVKE
jgi:hypothetical protein